MRKGDTLQRRGRGVGDYFISLAVGISDICRQLVFPVRAAGIIERLHYDFLGVGEVVALFFELGFALRKFLNNLIDRDRGLIFGAGGYAGWALVGAGCFRSRLGR